MLVEVLLVEVMLLKGFCLRYSRLRGCMNGIIAYNGKRNSCKGISLRRNTGGNTCSNGITARFFEKSLKKVHYYIQKKYLSSRIFFEVAKSRKMVQYYIQKKYLSSFFWTESRSEENLIRSSLWPIPPSKRNPLWERLTTGIVGGGQSYYRQIFKKPTLTCHPNIVKFQRLRGRHDVLPPFSLYG